MVNTPIPHSLKSEAKKAAKILREFSMPSAKTGPDKIIPADTIVNAAGLAILSVFKLGFLVTARGGSGIVIAKQEDGNWSAPSAIGIAGLGGGLEIGAEVTDFVIILNKKSAVEAFSKGGNLTLGGNFSVAAGPMGRSMEGDITVRSPAAIYTYSKTKGLYAGVSVEGSYLIERKDANKKFYGGEIRAFDILGGEVDRPQECFELYEVLDKHHMMYLRTQEAELKKKAREESEKSKPDDTSTAGSPTLVSRIKSVRVKSKSRSKDSKTTTSTRKSTTKVTRTYTSRSRSSSKTSHSSYSDDDLGATGITRTDEWDAAIKGTALWDFQGILPCDLSFKAGDEITIVTRMESQVDWWEGSFGGRLGIFPANYIEIAA